MTVARMSVRFWRKRHLLASARPSPGGETKMNAMSPPSLDRLPLQQVRSHLIQVYYAFASLAGVSLFSMQEIYI
jgi:hypothetical protein